MFFFLFLGCDRIYDFRFKITISVLVTTHAPKIFEMFFFSLFAIWKLRLGALPLKRSTFLKISSSLRFGVPKSLN